MDELADLSSSLELTLGQLVRDKYKADFFMLDQYPSNIRPFYTMPSPSNPLFSNRYTRIVWDYHMMRLSSHRIIIPSTECHLSV